MSNTAAGAGSGGFAQAMAALAFASFTLAGACIGATRVAGFDFAVFFETATLLFMVLRMYFIPLQSGSIAANRLMLDCRAHWKFCLILFGARERAGRRSA